MKIGMGRGLDVPRLTLSSRPQLLIAPANTKIAFHRHSFNTQYLNHHDTN
jgi:hypothetical protein